MCTVPKDLAVVSSSPAISPSTSSPAASSAVSHSLLQATIFPPSRRKRRRDGDCLSTSTAGVTSSSSVLASGSATVTTMRDTESNSALIDSEAATTTTSSTITTGTLPNADNTLLRKILAGADLASVRNHSVLVDSNFSLRRTSSMSTASSRYRSCTPDPNSDDKRRRRSTMFSHLTLPRRTSDHEEEEQRPCKRLKEHGVDGNKSGNSSPLVPIKVESRDPEDHPPYATPASSSSDVTNGNSNPGTNIVNTPLDITERSTSKFPGKPSKRWRLKSPICQSPSHSLSPPTVASTSRVDTTEVFPMRPRARTTSELDNVIRMFTEGKYHLNRFRLDSFDSPSGGLKAEKISTTPKSGDLRRGEPGDKSCDITSPLSQLLESTPPYSGGTNTIHPRANTTTSVFPWSYATTLKGSTGASPSSVARVSLPLPGNGSKHHLQHLPHRHHPDLEMLNFTKAPVTVSSDSVASILAATALNSSQFFQGIRNEQMLNLSRKEVSRQLPPPPPPPPQPPPIPPPISLSLTSDDILQWSPNQMAALQQLFRLPDTTGAVVQSISRPSVSQEAKLPIRLAHVNRLLLCRRVAEWMLVANNWAMQMCPAPIMPENSLLATAATYRYCRCSEAELSMAHQIDMRLEMPRVGMGLKAVLHRIWPQLLLASMIRENFSFSTTPIPTTELSSLIGATGGREGGGGVVGGVELNIAKAGTADSLKNLIKEGNQLFLDTQVFECVRKCIFAQHAFPDYYPISYSTAIGELRQCCHRCSGDVSLFNNVVLLMNEMQSINPEGLHCLFSIDRLSGLFVPASDPPSSSSSSAS
ncbi:conserved hypothetical protein [Echinococcus multilocularis]|uniref:Uncharacterized protein n=1 Tax=Echinococcus multilocularis TaxID=6211 RepID=A0A068Y7E4_ECHMU|nr:conserved hypothetical protein [Echinococcus multilocularis]